MANPDLIEEFEVCEARSIRSGTGIVMEKPCGRTYLIGEPCLCPYDDSQDCVYQNEAKESRKEIDVINDRLSKVY